MKPLADPNRNDKTALYTFGSLRVKDWWEDAFVRGPILWLGARGGCLSRRAGAVITSLGARVSSLVTAFITPKVLPSSVILHTR